MSKELDLFYLIIIYNIIAHMLYAHMQEIIIPLIFRYYSP